MSDSSSYASAKLAIEALTKKCNLQFTIQEDVYIIFQASKHKKTSYQYSGKIINNEDFEGLPFTRVEMGDHRFETDLNGNFSFLSKDSVTHLKMSYIGFRGKDTILTAGLQQTIIMHPSIIELDTVIITRRKTVTDSIPHPQQPVLYTANETGVIKINHEVATFLPGNNSNTIFNLLRLQPGVLAAGEQTNDYLIWGAYRGQTQIIYDGITLFNIGSYNDNVGAINPLMVKDIEVLKAGYNVHVGDRVGGVVNITGKTGNTKKATANIQLNQLIGGMNFNVPLSEKHVLQGAMRNSYYDLFPNPYIKENTVKKFSSFQTISSFRDYNLKFSGKESNGDHYYISTIKSSDEQFSSIEGFNGKEKINNDKSALREQYGVSLFYGKTWRKTGITNTTFAHSTLQTTTKNKQLVAVTPTLQYSSKSSLNSITESSLKTAHIFPVVKGNQIQVGLGVIKNTTLLERNLGNDYDEESVRLHSFIKNNISITKRWSMEPGLSVDHLTTISKNYFQPRVKSNYIISKATSLNVSSGIYNQFIIETLSQNPLGNNFYQWSIANDSTIKALKAWHHVGGVTTTLKNYKLKFEGFYKNTTGLAHLINDKQNKQTTFYGDNRAYGFDIYLEKKFNRHSFWASYTYSKSEEKFDNELEYRPSPQDQRHEIKGAALFNFNPIYVATNYVYGSGLPTIEPGKPLTNILTPYNRWDIAISYKVKKEHYTFETGISVINILNTENVRYNDFLNRSDGKTFYSQGMPFTPTLFLNIGF